MTLDCGSENKTVDAIRNVWLLPCELLHPICFLATGPNTGNGIVLSFQLFFLIKTRAFSAKHGLNSIVWTGAYKQADFVMEGKGGAYLKVCMRLRKLLYPYLHNTQLGARATQKLSNFQTISPHITHSSAHRFWHLNTFARARTRTHVEGRIGLTFAWWASIGKYGKEIWTHKLPFICIWRRFG